MKVDLYLGLMVLSGSIVLTACERKNMAEAPAEEAQPAASTMRAVATLEPKSGSALSGEAFFVEEDDNEIAFGVFVENVSPGEHAVHIHENGDCSTADASSAGGHWNPTNKEHGQWGVDPFHLGDIGNITVNEDGDGSLSLTTRLWSLDESSDRSVLGKSIVVHAGEDDFTTQPAGGAGARIGCGVVEWKKES